MVAAIAGGVLWSNALAYQEVNLAPRDRLAELEQIGERFAGEGPALMTEYEPYGVRHFLREADPEGASELRRRIDPAAHRQAAGQARAAPTSTNSQLGAVCSSTGRWCCAALRSQAARRPSTRWMSARPLLRRLAAPGGSARRSSAHVARRRPATDRPAELQRGTRPRSIRRSRRAPGGRDHPIDADHRLAEPGAAPTRVAARSRAGRQHLPDAGQTDPSVPITAPGRYGIWVGGAFRRELDVQVDGKRVTHRPRRAEPFGSIRPDRKRRARRGITA